MKITRIISYIILLIIIILGLTFAATNASPVKIDYYFNTTDISLSLLLTYTLGVGILLGFLAALFSILKLKNENRKLKNHLKKAEQTLQENQAAHKQALQANISTASGEH